MLVYSLVSDVFYGAVALLIAAQEPPPGENRAAEESIGPERVERVLRAARVVLAGAGEDWAEGPAPGIDDSHRRVPHVARLRTSSIRSPSQSSPRESAASGRPARARIT